MPPAEPHDPAPVPPVEPDPADCCGEGCPRCVYDVYDEAMERYQAELARWRARQPPGPSDRPLPPKGTSLGA